MLIGAIQCVTSFTLRRSEHGLPIQPMEVLRADA